MDGILEAVSSYFFAELLYFRRMTWSDESLVVPVSRSTSQSLQVRKHQTFDIGSHKTLQKTTSKYQEVTELH